MQLLISSQIHWASPTADTTILAWDAKKSNVTKKWHPAASLQIPDFASEKNVVCNL